MLGARVLYLFLHDAMKSARAVEADDGGVGRVLAIVTAGRNDFYDATMRPELLERPRDGAALFRTKRVAENQ